MGKTEAKCEACGGDLAYNGLMGSRTDCLNPDCARTWLGVRSMSGVGVAAALREAATAVAGTRLGLVALSGPEALHVAGLLEAAVPEPGGRREVSMRDRLQVAGIATLRDDEAADALIDAVRCCEHFPECAHALEEVEEGRIP